MSVICLDSVLDTHVRFLIHSQLPMHAGQINIFLIFGFVLKNKKQSKLFFVSHTIDYLTSACYPL